MLLVGKPLWNPLPTSSMVGKELVSSWDLQVKQLSCSGEPNEDAEE